VRYIPSWFPGAAFKVLAEEGYEIGRQIIQKPFAEANSRIVSGISLSISNILI